MADEQPKTKDDGSKAVPPKSSSNNKTLIIVLAIVAVVVILPMIAFGVGAFWLSRGDNATNLTEGILESTTGADVDIDKDGSSFNIETDEGSIAVGDDQEIPDNLPSAVVVYDNQKVVSVITNNQDGTTVWSFTSETPDESTKVDDFVKTKFAENGWTLVSSSTYNDTSSYSYQKDNLQALITITPGENGGKTNISYYVSQEPQEPVQEG